MASSVGEGDALETSHWPAYRPSLINRKNHLTGNKAEKFNTAQERGVQKFSLIKKILVTKHLTKFHIPSTRACCLSII